MKELFLGHLQAGLLRFAKWIVFILNCLFSHNAIAADADLLKALQDEKNEEFAAQWQFFISEFYDEKDFCRTPSLARIPMLINLIIQGADPNIGAIARPWGSEIRCFRRPLLWAAREGHKNFLEICLEYGADPHAVENESGWTALWWAAHNGHPEIVSLLILENNDAREQTNILCNVIMGRFGDTKNPEAIVAIFLEYGNIAKLLAKPPADLINQDKTDGMILPYVSKDRSLFKNNPLSGMILLGPKEQLIKYLLDATDEEIALFINKPIYKQYPLDYAIALNPDLIPYLIARGADPQLGRPEIHPEIARLRSLRFPKKSKKIHASAISN
jgi:hypothetical protein